MTWFDTFNAVFFLSAGSVVCAGLSVMLGYCFKSKCTEFSLCYGLIDVHRDAAAENEELKMELDHIPINTKV